MPRESSSINLLCLSVLLAFLCLCFCQAQQNEVSPKLDFDEAEGKENNNTVPIVPGVMPNRKTDPDYEREKDSEGNKKERTGPKIHGVRVTVDTGDSHKSKESKESVEITDLGKNKKRVGIHTDITFEITANGEDHSNNKTSRELEVDKEDASVPIFKGSRGGSHHKNPKTPWQPNFSSERRTEYAGRGYYPDYYSYHPEYYPNNVPAYIGSTDSRGAGSPIYHQSDGWNSYIPRWTTERSLYVEAHNKPSDVTAYRNNAWKPCYCMVNGNDYRKRRDNTPHYHFQIPSQDDSVRGTSSLIQIVEGKLDRPFSKK